MCLFSESGAAIFFTVRLLFREPIRKQRKTANKTRTAAVTYDIRVGDIQYRDVRNITSICGQTLRFSRISLVRRQTNEGTPKRNPNHPIAASERGDSIGETLTARRNRDE